MQVVLWVCEEMEVRRDRKEGEEMLKKLMKTIVCGFDIWLEESGTRSVETVALWGRSDSQAVPSEATLFGYTVENKKSDFCADLITDPFFVSWQATSASLWHHSFV